MTIFGTNSGKRANLRGFLGYALGETIIVTIRILIAFSLSNWNEDRIKKKLEKEYLQSMKNQLAEDLNTIKGVIEYNHLFSIRFQNNFDFSVHIMKEKSDIYHQAENRLDSIIGMIDNELKKK